MSQYGLWLLDGSATKHSGRDRHVQEAALSCLKHLEKKCPKEQQQQQGQDSTGTIVEYVSDYFNDSFEMLSFEQSTLFCIHIRFVHRDSAIAAQK